MSQVAKLAKAFDTFIKGCKADGTWDSIKASCVMAGWDGLDGALTPLVGTAPTNNNFVSGDYNRETGLIGDASTKYLDSNRAGNADPQNNQHSAVYVTISHTSVAAGAYITSGNLSGSVGATDIGRSGTNPDNIFLRSQSQTAGASAGNGGSVGFMGVSRSVSNLFNARIAGTISNPVIASQTPVSNTFNLFRFNTNDGFSNARLSFYSIGESLDLAALDTRVSTLMEQIFKGIYGIDFDDDAYAYITEIRSSGASVDSTQINAINTFVKSGKSDGWYSSIKRMYLPIWASAAPNAVDMITRASGTFNGTVTHSSGYVQGDGSTGYFDFGVSPSTLGLTNSSGLVGSLMKTADTRPNTFVFPIGARAAANSGQISSHQNNSATSAIGWIGRTSNAGTTESSVLTVSAVNAILLSNRNSSGLKIIQRSSTGLIESSVNSLEATDAITTQNIYGLSVNSIGSASGYTNAEIGALYVGLGLSDGNASSFTLALKNLWETSTGLTLP